MKNRTVLGVVCIALALLAVFVLAPWLTKMQDGRKTIVRMIRSVEKGHLITASDFELAEVGGYNLPDKVLTKAASVEGKYASVDLRPGDWLTNGKLTDTPDSASDVFRMLNGDKRAISVTVSNFASGLSGKLENGDIVSVCVTKDGQTFIPPELTYVKVITSTTQKGIDKDAQETKEDGSVDAPVTVTLLVNERQELLLAEYEQKAKMHFTLVFRGESNAANAFLQSQEKYFSPAGQEDVSDDGAGLGSGDESEDGSGKERS